MFFISAAPLLPHPALLPPALVPPVSRWVAAPSSYRPHGDGAAPEHWFTPAPAPACSSGSGDSDMFLFGSSATARPGTAPDGPARRCSTCRSIFVRRFRAACVLGLAEYLGRCGCSLDRFPDKQAVRPLTPSSFLFFYLAARCFLPLGAPSAREPWHCAPCAAPASCKQRLIADCFSHPRPMAQASPRKRS